MASPALPLSIICNVNVVVGPQLLAAPTFNAGLIIGNSGVIPSYGGSNPRIRKYACASLSQMLTDGFTLTSPEYIEASLYASQNPQAQYVYVGCADPSGINTANVHSGSAGTNYKVGDVVTVVESGASNGTLTITSINTGTGAVTGFSILTAGTGYTATTNLATTGGSGTGLTIDITALGETYLLATIACRTANTAWYSFCVTTGQDADHLALAQWATQTSTPATCYFYSTADTAVLNNVSGNIAATMQGALYNKVFGVYSTTQPGVVPGTVPGSSYKVNDILTITQGGASGGTIRVLNVNAGVPTQFALVTAGTGYTTASALATTGGSGSGATVNITATGGLINGYPNNYYFAGAVMGVAMGRNTGLANSYFTMKFKPTVGVQYEPLTLSQITTLEALNMNVYVGYANFYTWTEQGTVANGQFFDEVLDLDMLASQIQTNVVNTLVSVPAVPMTDTGQTMLINAVTQACEFMRVLGFIAQMGGVWNGAQLLNLAPGTNLPRGYLVQSPSYSGQTPAQRAARTAMPIYVALCESGAAHSLSVSVEVQR